MPNNFLDKIIEHKRQILKEKKEAFTAIKDKLRTVSCTRYGIFKKRIFQPGRIVLIAEIKKASPSAGLLREDFDLLGIAETYVKHNAAAISVLTEDKYFLGNPTYVTKIANHCHVPVLTKDFIIDENQIYEARVNGASAILLIMAILTDNEAGHFLDVAGSLDLDCLVEVHNDKELERALKCQAQIIGVNNRDLHNFAVDFMTCTKLIPKIPKDKVIVAESGIKTHQEVLALKKLGAHAVLIGETLMKEKDIGRKIEELMYGR